MSPIGQRQLNEVRPRMLTVGHARCSAATTGGAKAASSFFDNGAIFGASRENWRGARPLPERDGLADAGLDCCATLTNRTARWI